MAKAVYSTENIGHYGLSFSHYSHFTSPIRRYPDVIAHRLIQRYLDGKPSAAEDYIEHLCDHCSEMERKASDAERESTKYFQVLFMQDQVGKPFEGVISGVTEWGIYVEIVENKCEGMIRLKELSGDFYVFDEKNHAIVGHNSGRMYRLGDTVEIQVKNADLVNRRLDFELLGHEESDF
jgi:ribonuclease R/exosome complex exonuclease DIS3/RRP44